MTRDQLTTSLDEGETLARTVCRDLDLHSAAVAPSQAIIAALARDKSWMVAVRTATEPEMSQMSQDGITGSIRPLQPDVWQIVVSGTDLGSHREVIILALLAHLLRGTVLPQGCVRHAVDRDDDEWIGEDFARALLAELEVTEPIFPATTAPALPSAAELLISCCMIIVMLAWVFHTFLH